MVGGERGCCSFALDIGECNYDWELCCWVIYFCSWVSYFWDGFPAHDWARVIEPVDYTDDRDRAGDHGIGNWPCFWEPDVVNIKQNHDGEIRANAIATYQ